MLRSIFVILLIAVLLGGVTACGPGSAGSGSAGDGEATLQEAEAALEGYFGALAAGDYTEAAGWYGGSYEALIGYNPDVDAQDQAALLERACTVNGFVCLPLERAEAVEDLAGDQVQFQVQFQNPDGSLFVLGPCCGATAEEMPPQSTFEVRVQRADDGRILVMDLPVYRP